MGIKDYISELKKKRLELMELKRKENINRLNYDVYQFYKDSLKLSNATNGMVIIITPENEHREIAIGSDSHRQIAQDMFDRMDVNHIDFSNVDGDFGDVIPKEYNSIFIRMASIMNGPTIIYLPDNLNEFQLDRLKLFNEDIKRFNKDNKEEFKVCFEYHNKEKDIEHDLDDILSTISIDKEKAA